MVENIISVILGRKGRFSQDLPDKDFRYHRSGVSSSSLLTVHDAVVTELADHRFDFAIADIEIECEIANFMHANFDQSQPLGPVLGLIGISDVTQAITCAEYVTSRWGGFGLAVLDFVDLMVREKRHYIAERQSNLHMASKRPIQPLCLLY